MRITSDGNVGIGLTSPTEKLHVSGNAIITGDLTVSGTTTTIDTTNLNVEDKNITINYSTGDSSSTADGAGITIQDAVDSSNDATILWDATNDEFDFSHGATFSGPITVGVDDTGHDVKFFGASSGAFMLYDQSEDTLEIRGAAADATTSTGKLLLTTALTDINDGDVIGRIDFQAPLEAGSGDAIVVGATILAEADATFSGTVNSTDLVFLTGDSGAATEKLRIDSTGQVTFADGAIDVNIASHDGSNGLKLGGTLVTVTASQINTATDAATTGKAIAMAIVFA